MRVENDVLVLRERDLLDVFERFLGAEPAVHTLIFPFDGERTGVVDIVERANDLFEIDVSASDGAEFPSAAVIAERQVGAENAVFAVELERGVFHVDVENAVGEAADELDRVDHLPNEVRRLEVEPERRMEVERFERELRGVDIERDFRRVDFEREFNSEFLIDVEDRGPAFFEEFEAVVDPLLGDGREAVDVGPNGREKNFTTPY